MNKQEKLIAVLLGLALGGWLWYSVGERQKAAEAAAKYAAAHPAPQQEAAPRAAAPKAEARAEAAKPVEAKPAAPKAPERFETLANDEVELTLSTRGAVVKAAKMLKYAQNPGAISAENPALVLDFAAAPALALEGLDGVAADADFACAERGADFVVFRNDALTRRITLKPGYRLEVEETFARPDAAAANRLSLGAVSMGTSKNDILSIDSWDNGGRRPHVVHHGDDGDSPLKSYLVSISGGCGGRKDAAGMPARASVDYNGRQDWVAVKNRFFVSALAACSEPNTGFRATMTRDTTKSDYVLKSVVAEVAFAGVPASRAYTLYLGPKRQALLWDLGMKDVMEFGMWRWLCYPLVWVLNFFNSLIPNYGVAIILLTILVRLVFWPLTHKSTVGMRRMQEIQPKMKELQAKFKDNPQRLQQETWALYRENKVNPLSSCLPMLAQIPVFIALFTVLRSAVELRYAPFLWISDLSEPEALFAGWFPFGGLNILPLVMAGLTMLQSGLTPSTGDNRQQRMMMVMMPLMMLFMFYNFPSALSLYWALSTAFGVVQAWWIRKRYGAPAAVGGVEVVDGPHVTRQMRRHGN
ncbi:MAG: YidC/Oxa1 family insertase periplasmic-domain containing protein [Kiritimatiellia bacterium]